MPKAGVSAKIIAKKRREELQKKKYDGEHGGRIHNENDNDLLRANRKVDKKKRTARADFILQKTRMFDSDEEEVEEQQKSVTFTKYKELIDNEEYVYSM